MGYALARARRALSPRHIAGLSALATALVAPIAARAAPQIFPITQDFFSDPFLIEGTNLYIAGTEKSYLYCAGGLSVNCAPPAQNILVDTRNLEERARNANLKFSIAGLHPFRNANGLWMMALTLHVQKIGDDGPATSGWSVIAHAKAITADSPPLQWQTSDTLLVGSFAVDQVKANYDGKYFEDNGQLWLIYQKRLTEDPPRVGIVALRMRSPTTPEPGAQPVILLKPSFGDAEKYSEYYNPNNGPFKLVETGNITKINGKYVMAYSVGGYNTTAYKIGIAYSDTFLPRSQSEMYRKVTHADSQNVWPENGGNQREIYYLLQAQRRGWFNYIGNQVIAPGVPTLVKRGPDDWVVMFAGHNANSTHIGDQPGTLEAKRRRPYFAKIGVNIPSDKKVSDVDDETLGNWIKLIQ